MTLYSIVEMWLCLFACFSIIRIATTSECSTGKETLVATEGSVSSPLNEFGLGYPNNIDHCWVIRSNATVVIKFIRYHLEYLYDYLLIYENSTEPSDTSLRFRTDDYSDVTPLEFWLTGTTLIRFKTDENNTFKGFEFKYRVTPLYHVPGADSGITVLSINETVGRYKSSKHSTSFQQAWCLQVAKNLLVNVTFSGFVENNDELLIYSGLATEQKVRVLYNLTSFQHISSTFHFLGSITIVHKTQGPSHFEFDFSVSQSWKDLVDIHQPMNHWSGKAIQGAAFNFHVHPDLTLPSLEQACSLHLSCQIEAFTVPVSDTGFSEGGSGRTTYHFRIPSYAATGSCIQRVSCMAKSTKLSQSSLDFELPFPKLNPETVRIESVEHLPQAAVIQFRAVSDTACPGEEHNCKLRTANRISVLAQRVSQFQNVVSNQHYQCQTSLTTQFSLTIQAPDTSGSIIECQIFNGSFVKHPLLQDRKSNKHLTTSPTELPANLRADEHQNKKINGHLTTGTIELQANVRAAVPQSSAAAVSQIAVIALVALVLIILFGLAFVLIVRRRRQLKPRRPVTPFAMVRMKMATMNPQYQPGDATSYQHFDAYEYAEDNVKAQHSDAKYSEYEYAEDEPSNTIQTQISGVYVQ